MDYAVTQSIRQSIAEFLRLYWKQFPTTSLTFLRQLSKGDSDYVFTGFISLLRNAEQIVNSNAIGYVLGEPTLITGRYRTDTIPFRADLIAAYLPWEAHSRPAVMKYVLRISPSGMPADGELQEKEIGDKFMNELVMFAYNMHFHVAFHAPYGLSMPAFTAGEPVDATALRSNFQVSDFRAIQQYFTDHGFQRTTGEAPATNRATFWFTP